MKIGIVTFNRANNFGAFLQAYALNSYLKSCGYDAEFIDVKFNAAPPSETAGQEKTGKLKKIRDGIIRRLKARAFDELRKKYFKITPFFLDGDSNNSAFKDNYDAVIAGSDQVWNTDITRSTEAFYLNFVKKASKISYAASYGTDVLNKTEINLSKKNLPSYKAVSVRERVNAEYLSKSLGINASVVCDPVFLLDRNEWLKLLKIKKQNYILVYYMENSKQLKAAIETVKEKFGLPVKYVQGGLDKIEGTSSTFVGSPVKFLETIANAEIIITNSFHATAFSIIFHKRLYVVSHSKWNARLDNLLEYGKAKAFIINSDKNISPEKHEINGKHAYKSIMPLIENSKQFLSESLTQQKGGLK